MKNRSFPVGRNERWRSTYCVYDNSQSVWFLNYEDTKIRFRRLYFVRCIVSRGEQKNREIDARAENSLPLAPGFLVNVIIMRSLWNMGGKCGLKRGNGIASLPSQ